MDFSKDGFAKDMTAGPNDAAGSGSGGEGPDESAERMGASPKAVAAQDLTNRPVSGEVIEPGTDGERGPRAKGGEATGAKGRQGSGLMLIPPVTRDTGDHRGNAHFSAAGARFEGAQSARSAFARGWDRYAVPLALGFCLFGVGVATGGRFFGGAAPATPAVQAAGGAATTLADTNQIVMQRLSKMANEMQVLRARVDVLRVAAQNQTPENLRGVKKSLDGLQASFESAKAQTDASIAQVTARLDRLQHQEARLEKPVERLSHTGKSVGGPIMTGSIARAAPPQGAMVASATPTSPRGMARPFLGPVAPVKKRPHLLADWVVRDVYEGVALVEGPDGAIEVTRGELIPGAGRVEAIERKNGRWVVVTSRGIVGSLGD